eukprot:6570963-Pyramimonas_sp.AAC.1
MMFKTRPVVIGRARTTVCLATVCKHTTWAQSRSHLGTGIVPVKQLAVNKYASAHRRSTRYCLVRVRAAADFSKDTETSPNSRG